MIGRRTILSLALLAVAVVCTLAQEIPEQLNEDVSSIEQIEGRDVSNYFC